MQEKKLGLNKFDRNKFYLLNGEQNPEECDATDDDSSTQADLTNK